MTSKRNDLKVAERYVILQTMIPEKIMSDIRFCARNARMTVNELMCLVLREVCVSVKERTDDCHPLGRVFSLYRIMSQAKDMYRGDDMVRLYVFVGGEREKKYLLKFLGRRNIARSEMLRKAVRALEYVIKNSGKLAKKVRYVQDDPEEEVDEMSYVYSRMERMDFYRSIYR